MFINTFDGETMTRMPFEPSKFQYLDLCPTNSDDDCRKDDDDVLTTGDVAFLVPNGSALEFMNHANQKIKSTPNLSQIQTQIQQTLANGRTPVHYLNTHRDTGFDSNETTNGYGPEIKSPTATVIGVIGNLEITMINPKYSANETFGASGGSNSVSNTGVTSVISTGSSNFDYVETHGSRSYKVDKVDGFISRFVVDFVEKSENPVYDKAQTLAVFKTIMELGVAGSEFRDNSDKMIKEIEAGNITVIDNFVFAVGRSGYDFGGNVILSKEAWQTAAEKAAKIGQKLSKEALPK
jgi:hypothetical protein